MWTFIEEADTQENLEGEKETIVSLNPGGEITMWTNITRATCVNAFNVNITFR